MFNKVLIKNLTEQVADLKRQLGEKDDKIDNLMERLLRKEQIPQTPEKQQMEDQAGMEKFMSELDIFNDLEGGETGDSPYEAEMELKNNVNEFVNE